MAPLHHAHARLEPVPAADLDLGAGLVDQPFVGVRRVVADVLETVLARMQRAGDAPDDGAGEHVDALHDAAVSDGAAAGDAERSADQDLAGLDLELAGDHRVVGDGLFARSGLFGEVLEDEVVLAAQVVLPLARPSCSRGGRAGGNRGDDALGGRIEDRDGERPGLSPQPRLPGVVQAAVDSQAAQASPFSMGTGGELDGRRSFSLAGCESAGAARTVMKSAPRGMQRLSGSGLSGSRSAMSARAWPESRRGRNRGRAARRRLNQSQSCDAPSFERTPKPACEVIEARDSAAAGKRDEQTVDVLVACELPIVTRSEPRARMVSKPIAVRT